MEHGGACSRLGNAHLLHTWNGLQQTCEGGVIRERRDTADFHNGVGCGKSRDGALRPSQRVGGAVDARLQRASPAFTRQWRMERPFPLAMQGSAIAASDQHCASPHPPSGLQHNVTTQLNACRISHLQRNHADGKRARGGGFFQSRTGFLSGSAGRSGNQRNDGQRSACAVGCDCGSTDRHRQHRGHRPGQNLQNPRCASAASVRIGCGDTHIVVYWFGLARLGASGGYNTTPGQSGRQYPVNPLPMNKARLTYRDSGVDIDAGDELVERIKPLVKRAQRPEVLAGIGGFGALVEIPPGRYKHPVLVSGTDGVGTKLRLAIDTGVHDTIGIDLVAMCANDIVVQGAEPLFFLDYYATGKLQVDVAEAVIRGIVEGCTQAGAALVGGETAEMPGMYHGDDYDLAGFCVGVVEKESIIDGSKVAAGNAVIGLASSGPHSNGYSLVRKLIAVAGANAQTQLEGELLFKRLLTPTRIYVKPLLELMKALPVHGLAHITGGGLTDNIPRVVPEGLEVVLERKQWARSVVFDWLQTTGNIEPAEMYRTFNCGIGMVVIVPASEADTAVEFLRARGETASIIGAVQRGDRGVVINE